MTYVEWLRARKVLIGIGVVLAVFIVFALGARVWMMQYESPSAFVQHVEFQPGTTRQEMTLPDGTHRTIFDNPGQHEHVVVDDSGYNGKRITIDEPRNGDINIDHATLGSVSMNTTANGSMEHIVIESDHGSTLAPYVGVGWFLAMIVATFLGAPFARENDGHLEYALTKPASRVALALSIVLVDALTIIATVVATAVVLLALTLLFEPLRISFDGAFAMIASVLLVPLGWYALLNAATASLRRAYGVMLGLSWPVLFGLNGFVAIPWNDSILGRVGWALSHTFYTLNPITYLNVGGSGVHINTSPIGEPFAKTDMGLLIALGLFIIYTALAVVQWRRVEA